MSLAVSPAVKIFALVGVLGALVLGLGMMLMGGETEAVPTAVALPTKKQGILDAPARARKVAARRRQHAAANKALVTPAKAKPVAKVAAPAKAAKPEAAKPVRSGRRDERPAELDHGLAPQPQRRRRLPVGVGGTIDAMSRDEAAAGAASVGAGSSRSTCSSAAARPRR